MSLQEQFLCNGEKNFSSQRVKERMEEEAHLPSYDGNKRNEQIESVM